MKDELLEDVPAATEPIKELLGTADADSSSPEVVAAEIVKAQEQLATATVPSVVATLEPRNDDAILSSGSGLSSDFVFPSSREEIESMDEDQFPKLVDACKSHPKFPAYRKHEYDEIGDDQAAEFADPNESDPLEDVIGFCEFLKTVAESKSDALVPVPAPASPELPPPAAETPMDANDANSQAKEPSPKRQKLDATLEVPPCEPNIEEALDTEVEKATVPPNVTQSSAAEVAARLSREVQDSKKYRLSPKAKAFANPKPKAGSGTKSAPKKAAKKASKKDAKTPVPANQSISAAISRAAKAKAKK